MSGGREHVEEITSLLEESGVGWEIERRSKHLIVKVGGAPVVALSQGKNVKHRTAKNTVARLRRHLKELADG